MKKVALLDYFVDGCFWGSAILSAVNAPMAIIELWHKEWFKGLGHASWCASLLFSAYWIVRREKLHAELTHETFKAGYLHGYEAGKEMEKIRARHRAVTEHPQA
jgi:hypothetical protein